MGVHGSQAEAVAFRLWLRHLPTYFAFRWSGNDLREQAKEKQGGGVLVLQEVVHSVAAPAEVTSILFSFFLEVQTLLDAQG